MASSASFVGGSSEWQHDRLLILRLLAAVLPFFTT